MSLSGWHRSLFWGALALVVNSAYLAAAGDPELFYFANVLLHLGLGLALLGPFTLWWWQRRSDRAVLAGGALIWASVLCALWLWWIDNLRSNRPWLVAHVALALLGLTVLLAALARARRTPQWRLAAAALPGAIAAAALALWWQSTHPDPRYLFDNPPAPLSMAEESMGGENGPFFPSSVRTTHGGAVESKVYMGSESCARSGCHPDIFDQWNSSAHHFSSFNNQWYRKSIEYMQEVAGVQASKWCGGCHDPAILQSGMMDTPIAEIVNTPEAQTGLSCTACHMISNIKSSMGQGDYEITVPPLHDLATSKNPLLTTIHDTLVKLDPEPHRRTFLKPFFENANSPEFCASCHKVHLDVPVNSYRWIRGFNAYDNWQASGVSGFGARSFYYPPAPRNCIDCHMPLVESDDAANTEGLVHSHRFPAANTALPIANRDDVQLKVVTDFLQARQVTVDIFAMTEAEAVTEAPHGGMELEGPALATSFAVGEEQGMAVGRGGTTSGEAETLFAPLDRVPATVRRGESMRVDVVVRTRGVGHFFPGGTVDAFEVWAELKATDELGQVLYWSGMADENSPVEPGAAFYRSLMIDAHGNPIDKRNAYANRAVVYAKLIPPGAGDTVRFPTGHPPLRRRPHHPRGARELPQVRVVQHPLGLRRRAGPEPGGSGVRAPLRRPRLRLHRRSLEGLRRSQGDPDAADRRRRRGHQGAGRRRCRRSIAGHERAGRAALDRPRALERLRHRTAAPRRPARRPARVSPGHHPRAGLRRRLGQSGARRARRGRPRPRAGGSRPGPRDRPHARPRPLFPRPGRQGAR
jgi:hypothetical protein